MKIFIGWSGERSLIVATKLKEWLPCVLPFAEPWLSTEDIRKGSRWQAEISEGLRQSNVGILILTRNNLTSSWLHFEAGAISNLVSGSSPPVCTYLIDIANSDVDHPLGMFQATHATRADTLELMRSLNRGTTQAIPAERLERAFAILWPELDTVLAQAKNVTEPNQTRSEQLALLDEILATVRGTARADIEQHAAVDLGQIVRQLADTPGTSTHDLFKRMDAIGRLSKGKPTANNR